MENQKILNNHAGEAKPKTIMKILIFTTASPFHELTGGLAGGAEYALRSVAENMALLGHDVYYVSSSNNLRKVLKHNFSNLNVIILPYKFNMIKDSSWMFGFHVLNSVIHFHDRLGFRNNRLRSKICRIAEWFRYSKKDHPSLTYIESLHKTLGFDIIHCYSSPPDLFIAERLKTKFDLPFTVRMGGRFYYNYFKSLNNGKKQKYQKLFKQSFDSASYFLFNSSSLLDNSYSYFEEMEIKFPKERASVLDIGIDIDILLRDLKDVQLPVNKMQKKRILCVGKFKEGSKRQDILLKVLRLIDNGDSNLKISDLHVDFAGGGDLLDKHIQLAKDLKVQKNCTFHGNVPKKQICEMLKSADLFILPTDFEGSSKAIAEALLAQTPVLASNITANVELLESSNGGLLFENTEHDLLKKIEYALENYDLMTEKAQKGYQFVIENLNPKVQAKRYEELFYKVIGQKHP